MQLTDIERYCESPIEALLARAIATLFSDFEEACMVLAPLEPCEYEFGTELPEGASAFLIPQAEVSGCGKDGDWFYRVDFLLVCGRKPLFRRAFAIECDGHDWHEKTKEQVARDKLRDRRLLLDGITPVRFSGSEIHRDAAGCTDYLRSLAHSTLGDVLGEQYTWEELKGLRKPRPVEINTGLGYEE
ncbi:hypothetical protein [Lysobacter sp. F6437]|uniref:hypothetical protein n=1 Tax=Lysobacter sp. F6437 TaxID=3459296 RepID=UPI00403D8D15